MTVPTRAEAELAELAGVPLTLLPVRLETRFVRAGGGGGGGAGDLQLRLRVYPDQVHLDAHQPGLTEAEVAAGKRYWLTRADPDLDQAARAWPELIRGVRATRALWIVRATTPSNPAAGPLDLVFPAVASRPAQLDQPMAVRAMPSRWVALGYDRRGTQVLRRWFDAAVADGLTATSPDDGAPLEGDAAVDAYLGWAANYDDAVTAGMAVTITGADLAAGHRLAEGLDRLVVLGVRGGDPAAGAAELEALLAAHEVSDGLAYLKPGTPTNNLSTAAAAASVVAVADPATAAPALDATWSTGARVERALGLGPGTLGRLPGAEARTALVSADLVDATWSATLGHFADQLLSPLISDGDLVLTRRHAVRHLQPLGPLPTLRVGRQPLGLVPVLRRGGAAADTTDAYAARLARVLSRLRPLWQRSVPRVPRLLAPGAEGQPLEAVLLTVLRRAPWTTRIWYRRVFGPLIGLGDDGIGRAQRLQAVLRTIGFVDALGSDVQPAMVAFGVHDQTRHLPIPLLGRHRAGEAPSLAYLDEVRVATSRASGRRADRAARYERARCAGPLRRPPGARPGRGPIRPLPGSAQERAHGLAHHHRGQRPGRPDRQAPQPPRAFHQAHQRLGEQDPDRGGGPATAEHAHGPRAGRPAGFQRALTRLTAADPVDVDPALRALLGTCSHRLDAWITSLANRRLDAVRTLRPTGTHLGGFGYVEDLRPDPVDGPGGGDSLGYVLGPSLDHAATAGILRSGHLGQRSTGTEALDIDLSSRRVRLALELVRGVGEGVPLPVLLGYRLERALRDAGLSVLILPLRTVFPLRTVPTPDVGGPVESTPPSDVVDAALLLDRWPTRRNAVLASVAAAADLAATDSQLSRMALHVDRLADVYDAVGDVVLAEAVHQVSRGQLERAQAATRFLDRQEPPVEPEVTAAPRTSTGYVQRCLVVLTASQPSAAWHALADPRSRAEPRLNTWLAALLGPPERWRFTGRSMGADGQPVVVDGRPVTATVEVTELGLSPLSLMVAANTGGADQPTELEERVASLLGTRFVPPVGGGIELAADTPATPTDVVTPLGLAAFAALLSSAWRVLKGATPADARAFDRPDGEAGSGLDVAELQRRADNAVTALASATTRLDQLIAAVAPTATQVANVLAQMSRVGVPGAVPPLGLLAGVTGRAPAEAVDVARDVAGVAHARLARLAALDAGAPAADGPGAAAHHQQRIATVFGDAFPVLGRFTLAAPSDAAKGLRPVGQHRAAARGSAGPGDVDDQAGPGPARARRAVAPVGGGRGRHRLRRRCLFRHPGAPRGRRAVGGPALRGRDSARGPALGAGPRPVGHGRALDRTDHRRLDRADPPRHRDGGPDLPLRRPVQPGPPGGHLGRAPSSAERPWNLDVITDTVLEAFDLARLRGVTLHDLPTVGAVLPALYLPLDPEDNVPSVDLDELANRFAPTTNPVLGKD